MFCSFIVQTTLSVYCRNETEPHDNQHIKLKKWLNNVLTSHWTATIWIDRNLLSISAPSIVHKYTPAERSLRIFNNKYLFKMKLKIKSDTKMVNWVVGLFLFLLSNRLHVFFFYSKSSFKPNRYEKVTSLVYEKLADNRRWSYEKLVSPTVIHNFIELWSIRPKCNKKKPRKFHHSNDRIFMFGYFVQPPTAHKYNRG